MQCPSSEGRWSITAVIQFMQITNFLFVVNRTSVPERTAISRCSITGSPLTFSRLNSTRNCRWYERQLTERCSRHHATAYFRRILNKLVCIHFRTISYEPVHENALQCHMFHAEWNHVTCIEVLCQCREKKKKKRTSRLESAQTWSHVMKTLFVEQLQSDFCSCNSEAC